MAGKELLASALVAGGREVNFAELHIFMELGGALGTHHGALVVDVLGFLAHVVALFAKHAHEVKPLRAAGKTADERSRAFVLTATHLNAYCVLHRGNIAGEAFPV